MNLGKITRRDLDRKEYPWFSEGWQSTSIDRTLPEFKAIQKFSSQIEVLVFLGTWCGDSHDQVPPFLKILDAAGVPEMKIQLFGLGRDKSFPGFQNTWKIERLPTFVFVKNGVELGRITETPGKFLLADTAAIINRRVF